MNRGARDGPLYPHLLCHCNLPAVYRQCKSAGNPSRIGKMLYGCRYYGTDKSCEYVQWEDQYIEPPRQVLCRCGEDAPCQVSKQPHSRGQKFYSCRYWQDEKRNCKYFLWHAQLMDINPAPVQRGNKNVVVLHDPEFQAEYRSMAAPYRQDNIRVRGTTLGPRQKKYKGIQPLPKERVRGWVDEDFTEPSESSAGSSETSDCERVEPSFSENSSTDDSYESDQSFDGFVVDDDAEIEFEDCEVQPTEFTTPHRCTRSGRGYTRDEHDVSTPETINLISSSESHDDEADDESSDTEQESPSSDYRSDQCQHIKSRQRICRRIPCVPPAPKKTSNTRSKVFSDSEDEEERTNVKEPQNRKKMKGSERVKRPLKRKKVEGTRRLFRDENNDSGRDSPGPRRQKIKRTKFTSVYDDSLSELSV